MENKILGTKTLDGEVAVVDHFASLSLIDLAAASLQLQKIYYF